MSAYRVIDKMEIVVREGLWLPFGWRAVNADQVLDLIEKLRSTLPDDNTRTKRATDSSADVASGAPLTAPVPDAKAKSASTPSADEAEILARAQTRAESIVADAQAAARDIRRGADDYADQVLASLDASLGKALAAVQKGRQALATPASAGNGKTQREMSTP